MPPTAQAAAVTDRHRQQLLAVREQVTTTAVDAFLALDLDRPLDPQIARWSRQAVSVVELGQRDAARLTAAYLPAYLAAAGLTSSADPLDVDRYVGLGPFGRTLSAAIATAPRAMLWRLAHGVGRRLALATGVAEARRAARSSIMGAARASQADLMADEPAVTGWRRVTSPRPCGGCLSAADGRTVTDRQPMPIHDSCRCTAEAVLLDQAERFARPTGQQLFDRLTRAEQDELFTGRGGAEKAAVVRARGVGVLAAHHGGRLTEAALADL